MDLDKSQAFNIEKKVVVVHMENLNNPHVKKLFEFMLIE